MKKPIFLVVFLLAAQLVFAQSSITVQSASRILKALSSDDMNGRHAFSEDIWKAADLISNEFDEIGLKTLPKLDSYLQKFYMYSVSLQNAAVSINGESIHTDQYFALIDNRSVEWDESSDVKTITISSGEDFRAKYGEINEMTEPAIIWVHPSHTETFNRYQRFFSRPSRRFDFDDVYNKVFVITETASVDNYSIELTKDVETLELANVAGMIEGKRSDEIVLFSAHYDHIGTGDADENGDTIFNGANDDASGTTAVIELARYFSTQEKPERTLYFVAFTAEEVGGFGSQYFSRQLDPDQIMAMFNIEMIGKPAVSGPNTAWITGFERSSFGTLLQKSAAGTIYEFYADPYPNQRLFFRSDNATLARLGVPAHTISTTPIDVDPDYHEQSDEYDTIDIEHMTNTIKAIAKAAIGIISGKDTPTRVQISQAN